MRFHLPILQINAHLNQKQPAPFDKIFQAKAKLGIYFKEKRELGQYFIHK